MHIFENILSNCPSIASADDVYRFVNFALGDPQKLKSWRYDVEVEAEMARKIAVENPDALLPIISAFQQFCIAHRRYPNDYETIMAQMRRTIADALAPKFSNWAFSPTGLNVLIMVPWLAQNPNGNILRVVAGYMSGLQTSNEINKVSILITNENAVAESDMMPGRRLFAEMSSGAMEAFDDYGINHADIYYGPPPFAENGCVTYAAELARTIKPNVVFVPNVEMTSYFIDGISKSSASLYLQTSLNNRPPYDFDRYLYLGERRKIDDTHIHPERWFYHKFGYALFGAKSNITRREIGLNEDDIVLVTAGNRLEREVNPEIAAIVAGVLRKNAKARWMLLGVQDENAIRRNIEPVFEGLESRLICHGYVKEIGRYFQLSDIYVNPRRSGGAVSMALSVYGSTPVVSFPMNDACNFILPELVYATPATFGESLLRLSTDLEELANLAERQRYEFLCHHSVEASAADLVIHMKEAIAERLKR